MAEDDRQLLTALAQVVEASDRFSFGILTDTLSVAEQLAFGYRLIHVAGRIRARVEKEPVDSVPQAVDGDAL